MDLDYLGVGPDVLRIERRQLADAGRLTDAFAADLDDCLRATARGDDARDRARELLERARTLPPGPLADDEPDEPAAVRAARPDGPRTLPVRADAPALADRLAGAWAGRCAGCWLGKPVETWTRGAIERFLDATGQSLDGYLRVDVPGAEPERFDLAATGGWRDREPWPPRDDDVDFTVAAVETLRTAGRGFESADVARTWLDGFPARALHTAERVAYRNLLDGAAPPASARRRNPYRELIGATIRADAYGYANPGRPARAAAMAARDARVSHVRNGVYGARWVAATLAAVPASGTLAAAARVGLTEVPARSRLAAAVRETLDDAADGRPLDALVDDVHAAWDDGDAYEGYHAVPNARVVAAVLAAADPTPSLGRALARAVRAGFDADCNAATVGSAVGLARGRDALPERWRHAADAPLRVALAGRPRPTLAALAADTAALAADPPADDAATA
jgi:ADP-ribosylglycohydrolase